MIRPATKYARCAQLWPPNYLVRVSLFIEYRAPALFLSLLRLEFAGSGRIAFLRGEKGGEESNRRPRGTWNGCPIAN